MTYAEKVLFEPILGSESICCRRCNRVLTNPKSVERGYGPVCWQKIEVELWFGDVALPEVGIPTPRSQRKARNIRRVEPLAVVQRTLDEFFFVAVPSHLADLPTPLVVLVEA